MTAASLNEIYKMLGELNSTTRSIKENVDVLRKDQVESEAASAVSRANVHRRLDEVVLRMNNVEVDSHTTKTKITAVEQKVETMETVTEDVKKLRHQAQGAGTLGHWLIKIGIGVVAFAGWLIGIYTWITGRPPP